MREHDMIEIVSKYNASRHIKHLEPHKDAVKYVKMLHEEGFSFVVISSLSDEFNAQAYRYENLCSLFGDDVFHTKDIHLLKTGQDKQELLEDKWGDFGYFWIEDHFRNAEAGHEVGLRSILIDSSYNRHYQTDFVSKG